MSAARQWAKAAAIRAVKTAAQAMVAGIGMSAMISEVDWFFVCGNALLMAMLSLLTSVAGLPEAESPFAAKGAE